MRLVRTQIKSGQRGYALMLTVVFGATTLMVLAGALHWSSSNLRLNMRSNQYFRTVAAAEASTEAVISRLSHDYSTGGDALVQGSLVDYRKIIPKSAETAFWSGYKFTDDLGNNNRTQVIFRPPAEFRELSSQYRGLYGYASAYTILSAARETSSPYKVAAAVKQEVETATIPLFQFAIFYNLDLEINPGPDMTITGPVHCNQNIYIQPQSELIFADNVTAAGTLIHDKKPGDPLTRSVGTITYQKEHDGGVAAVTMPIGTNNTSAAVRQVVEVPPTGESATSQMGEQRYYNKADLVIKVTDSGVSATSGRVNNFATVIPSAQSSKFVTTGEEFFNKRESRTIQSIDIDVGALRKWNQTNSLLRPILSGGGDIKTVYVVDQRTYSNSSKQPGVRLVNGQTILPQGLTVVTPNPLYVKGHYNAPTAALGTSDTSGTLPASLVGDAITILSSSWDDDKSTQGLSNRIATDTTVNAAFLAGIVQTDNGQYSGGVENFPRFLEDWGSKVFTYNGSMVVMYDSVFATGEWGGTGNSNNIYNPPIRNWNFDTNFKNPAKIPPSTPSARATIRGSWAMVTPTTTF